MDFKTNNVNETKFPFSIWSKVTREVLTDKNTQLLNPTPFNGTMELREEIANYFDCSDKKLQEESILAVLNYVYDLGKRGK